MRLTSINIGYNFWGEIIAEYQNWNRDHTVMMGGDLTGDKEIGLFIKSLRKDNYKGLQVVKIFSTKETFSEVCTTLQTNVLEKMANNYSKFNVQVHIAS